MNALENRCRKLCAQLEQKQITCLLITPSSDMKYLTELSLWADERLMTAVFAPGHTPFLIANKLLEGSLAGCPYQDIVYWLDGEDPCLLLRQELEKRGISTESLALDNAMAAGIAVPLLKALPYKELHVSSEVTAFLRLYKDAEEIRRLRTACRKASDALRITMSRGREWIGYTESELAAALCTEMVRQGLAYGSASVSAGKNAADAHHFHTDKVIEDNMCVWIDFGSVYQNYQTDMTRVFWFGEPDPEYAELVRIVNEARQAGIDAAVAGNPLGAVDDAAHGVITRYGYGEYFTHRTGHGIGIMNHEGPSAAQGEKTVIAPGMTFSCEPGIYLPGRWGVRVEDELLIGEDGKAVPLHDFPTELIVFGKDSRIPDMTHRH